MYATFAAEWVARFPRKLLVLRTEELLDASARPRALARTWRHLGLSANIATEADEFSETYATWTERLGGGAGGMDGRTGRALYGFYAPLNRRLRDLLAADGASCDADDCDAFLWRRA